jgi:hypothetical protein
MKNILIKIFTYMIAYSGVILATIGILTVVGVVLHSAYVTSIPLFIFLCGLILFLVGVVIMAIQNHEDI